MSARSQRIIQFFYTFDTGRIAEAFGVLVMDTLSLPSPRGRGALPFAQRLCIIVVLIQPNWRDMNNCLYFSIAEYKLRVLSYSIDV